MVIQMPRLAINMLVLNAESVLDRALRPFAGVVNELVVVDSGSEDGTKAKLEEIATLLKLDRYYYERLHPCGSDFFTDEKASWSRGMPEPFTGRRVLADFAKARNVALENTTADYILKLDADDELRMPAANLLGLLDHLDKNPHVAIASAPYEVMDGQGNHEWLSMYDRIWRRSSCLRWKQPMHEYLGDKTASNTMYVLQGLIFRDWRDNSGEGVRIAHRNLKVLLHYWENMDPRYGSRWAMFNDLVFRFTLAHESAEVYPAWSREHLANIITRLDPSDVGMLSDCHYHKGRSLEAEGRNACALEAYQKADVVASHTQALLRAWTLARRFQEFAEEVEKVAEILSVRLEGVKGFEARPYNCDLRLVKSFESHHP
jgi:glycosyltransferase involved in cell wall biosynthesis